MAAPLKDMYSPTFYNRFSQVLKTCIADLDTAEFQKRIFVADWEQKELKDRMRHTSLVLHEFMPADFMEAIECIQACIVKLKEHKISEFGFEFMFFPDYIELYGQNHFEEAMSAMKEVTKFASCEFAVRPFIIANQDRSLDLLTTWSLDENEHVRRLASEGSRPRLPWAMALPALKKNPAPIQPILENLKNDPSEYVRRSVANNLNDISKDHPDFVLEIFKDWIGKDINRNKLVKHGARTLLKKGDVHALSIFGLGPNPAIQVENLKILSPVVKIGDYLSFEFKLENTSLEAALVRLEYAIYYKGSTGDQRKKVFKISEKTYPSKSKKSIQRRQSFKLISTRRFYEGVQGLSIIINGVEQEKKAFELING